MVRKVDLERLRWALLGGGTWLAVACGGKAASESSPSDGGQPDATSIGTTVATTGAGGDLAGGGPASTGAAGQPGGGGAGGSGGRAGAGGSSGGKAGSAGSGAVDPECTSASDCKLVSDCCTCAAVAPGEAIPSCPPIECLVAKCQAQQLPSDSVACVAGRCVAGFDCDASKVICKALPPMCDPGQLPAVKAGCYTGVCVPATECRSVTSCQSCQPLSCAAYTSRTGAEYHCVKAPAACGGNETCSCIGPSVCTAPYSACIDFSGLRGVACTCPTCS